MVNVICRPNLEVTEKEGETKTHKSKRTLEKNMNIASVFAFALNAEETE